MPDNSPTKRSKTPLIVVLVIVLAACIVAGILGSQYLITTYTQIRDVENSQNIEPVLPSSATDAAADASASATSGSSDQAQQGTIDFAALQQQNPDIYAWVFIPDTGINYPVCQSPTDNAYYLTHDASGADSDVGAIFSEAQFNHTDFQDRVTILYGHNGYGDTMFTNLHEYSRQEHFDAHNKVYIYVPGHIYTYQVVNSFTSGDRHIMDAFNFTTDEGFMAFADFLKNPGYIDSHYDEPVEIAADDKLLVLSTCNTGALEAAGRYLVCGVLIDDEPAE